MNLVNKLKDLFKINTDVYHNIDKNIKFGYKYGLFFTKNGYSEANKYNKSQIIKVIVMKLMTFVTIFRYLMTAMVPKKWMIVSMSDAMYLLGYNRLMTYPLIRLSSFMFSQFALVIFTMTFYASLAELKKQISPYRLYVEVLSRCSTEIAVQVCQTAGHLPGISHQVYLLGVLAIEYNIDWFDGWYECPSSN